MADIFISCSRLDLDRVKPIAERLTSQGYSLSWEPQSAAAGAGRSEQALRDARAVLTVWTDNARNSPQVCAESSLALDAQKLVQLRLDAAPPPAPFDVLHVADMSDRGEWGALEDAISQIVRRGAVSARLPQAPRLLATLTAAGAPKVLLLALAMIIAAYAGALPAAMNGLMSPDQLEIALVGMLGVAAACAILTAHRLISISRAGS